MTRKIHQMVPGVLFLTLLLAFRLAGAIAQDDRMVLSVNANPFVRSHITRDLISEFEALHPGVTVYVIDDREVESLTIYGGLEAHLDHVETYVATADVLGVYPFGLTLESTRAGYWLDLAPLAAADPAFDPTRIHPSLLQAYQWEGGLWAIPYSTTIIGLSYDAAAFDAAGQVYPSDTWTVDDFANVTRALAQATQAPAFPGYGSRTLVRSFLGDDWYQDVEGRIVPAFDNPVLEESFRQWDALVAEGAVDPVEDYSREYPLQTEGYTSDQGIVPLPGNQLQLHVFGFAVSAGTQHPFEAYELARFLAEEMQLSGDPYQMPVWDNPFTFDGDQALQAAMNNAIWSSRLHFAANLRHVFGQEDIATALAEAYQEALAGLALAEARRGQTTLVVKPPALPIPPEEGISLSFGASPYGFFVNRSLWNDVVDEFMAADPAVGEIRLTVDQEVDAFRDYDCYYTDPSFFMGMIYQAPNGLLDLRPLVDADPTFDRDDLLPGLYDSLLWNGTMVAFPISIQPRVLVYDRQVFQEAGVPVPDGEWSIYEFAETLRALKSVSDSVAAFHPGDFQIEYLLLLIAAHGGLPIDNRTTPPTIHFTDPDTVDAIRYVLDLARDGYIDYLPLPEEVEWSSPFPITWPPASPIFTTDLSPDRFHSSVFTARDTYGIVQFPQGEIPATSYSVAVGVINAETPYPEACYRWLSTVSLHPELYVGIPARQSLLDSPAIFASQGADVIQLYQQFNTLLHNEDVVNFRVSPNSFAGQFYLQWWLSRAFNRYVLEDADLEAELEEAELLGTAYLECIEQGGDFWSCRIDG